jgi:hypothetical protein
MSSVAFWYQTEPHKPWAALPPGPERLAEHTQSLIVGWKAVPEAKHSDHPVQVQELGAAREGKQLWFTPRDDKGWVEVAFTIDKGIQAFLCGNLVQAKDYGTYRVKLDGQEIGTVDLYNPEIKRDTFRWGLRTLAAGSHVLRFECIGKSDRSTGYLFGLDSVAAVVPVYQRAPGFDLRKIQK